MHISSSSPSSVPTLYPIPNRLAFYHVHHRRNLHIPTSLSPLTLSQNNLPRTGQEQSYKLGLESFSDHSHSYYPLTLRFYPSIDTHNTNHQNPEFQNQKQGQKEEQKKDEESKLLSSNMWWADLKAAFGQRFNLEAICFSAKVIVREQNLALPHIFVPDIRYIDWAELHGRGFRGVVFDKDNTLTVPYALSLWDPLRSSLEKCKLVFGPDIAVFSNSAGLKEYDHDGSKAKALEGAIGIKVIRHRVKKPAGPAEEIEKHFGYKSSQLIMVGDRPFTDVIFGNKNSFLTILTEPLSLAEEPFVVRQVRKFETSLLNHWRKRGVKPASHKLLPDPISCVKDPSPS